MSDETNPMPCPFCGGVAKTDKGLFWYVHCTECPAELGANCDYDGNPEGEYSTEEQAVSSWNTRDTHGTLTAEQVRKCVRVGACDHGLWGALDEDTDWQEIADELNAELGSGTCNPVETEVITYYDEYGHDAVKVHVMECDECGGTYEHVNGDYERCPRCGKAVER